MILFANLSQAGVDCYIVGIFVGAIAYVDDIVLIQHKTIGMRKLLFTRDSYAFHSMLVNQSSSECFPGNLRNVFNNVNACLFYIGGRPIENVSSYSQLGTL